MQPETLASTRPSDAALESDHRVSDHDPQWNLIRWRRILPTLSIHLLCLGVIWVGWSWAAVIAALALYLVRMFAITAFYHRYFSHRTFRTHRVTQFIFAAIGASSAQRGPLWWAAHHREHHRRSDREGDVHSPGLQGVLWSHFGWFLAEPNIPTNYKATPDLVKYPELVWINRWHVLPVLALAAFTWLLGAGLAKWAPGLGTSGAQMFVWGFAISTVLLHHATFTINSLAHMFGRKRYPTKDDSRNNLLLAIITLGEGWHNNHHYAPGAARQGFYWWEIDISYYILALMRRLGLVWDLNPAPERVYRLSARIEEAPAADEVRA